MSDAPTPPNPGPPTPSVSAAEAQAAEARRRLNDTVSALQERLDPKALAAEAVEGITEGGGKALRGGVEAAKRNPARFAGAVALVGAFLARHRIKAMWRKRRDDKKPQPIRRVRSPYTRTGPTGEKD